MKNKNPEKNFGIIFGFLFLIISVWPLKNGQELRIWSSVISIIFFATAFIYPKILKSLNKYWIKLGELLGKIIAPIVMLIVFFIFVTPISFLVRIFGKDLLGLKLNKEQKSYWIKVKKEIGTMKNQF